jgi:Tfp pilus assembly protein PilF
MDRMATFTTMRSAKRSESILCKQYLIAMPGGRLQALGIAWDSRPRAGGGQRWFFLYPGQKITVDDSRHWTGLDQNWNYIRADCYSTNLRKNYDARTRTFSTSYSELDVSCEACHGPGSNHLRWARKESDSGNIANEGLTTALDERKGVAWSVDQATGNAQRSGPRQSEREIQMCARCHSRRGEIQEDYVHGQPVGDDYRVALLDEGLYFPDGQIKEEDYEYGSFVQSKMFHAGVTCGDCHEPHNSKLRADGNVVCGQCHLPQKYDSPAHHFHKTGSAGARCVGCHMPTRTYMVVDVRRDHSLRIPVGARELNADRPEARLNLGLLYAKQNHPDQAEAELKTALSLDPRFAPAAVNLADLFRALNRDREGEAVLTDALKRSPKDASLEHALGLLMVRQKHYAQAVELLAAAVHDEPANARYVYVYAVALSDTGQAGKAIKVLESSIKAHPYDRNSLEALVGMLERSGDSASARSYARRLKELEPDNPEIRGILKEKEGLHG